jgi:hypothetical protein
MYFEISMDFLTCLLSFSKAVGRIPVQCRLTCLDEWKIAVMPCIGYNRHIRFFFTAPKKVIINMIFSLQTDLFVLPMIKQM